MSAINELVDDLPGPGHNQPPPETLAEILVEETAALKRRAEELLAGAQRAVITDRESAERGVVLIRMMTEHRTAIIKAHDARKEPFWEACKTIDHHFQALRADLVGTGPKLGGEALRIRCLVDSFYAEEERKAEIERLRLKEEARKAQDAAAAAERERLAAEEAARVAALQGDAKTAAVEGTNRFEAELRQRQAAAEALRLAEQAAQTKAAPINTGIGITASRKISYKVEITDLTLALRHARKINEARIREVVQALFEHQVRDGARSLPGARITEDRQTIIRRA